MPSMRGHLMFQDGEVRRRRRLETVEGGGAVRVIGHDAVALGLECNRKPKSGCAVIVDQGDRRHKDLFVRGNPASFEARKAGPKVCLFLDKSHDSSKALPSIRELWQWRKALADAQKYGKPESVAKRKQTGEGECSSPDC